jgi:hypothetical protein
VSRRQPRPPPALQSKWPSAAALRRRSGRRRERGARTLTRRAIELQLRGTQFASFTGAKSTHSDATAATQSCNCEVRSLLALLVQKVRILTPQLRHRPATHLQHTPGEDADAMTHQHSKATYLHYTAWLRAREAEAARVKSAGVPLSLLALLVQKRSGYVLYWNKSARGGGGAGEERSGTQAKHVRIRQQTSADVSRRQQTSAYVSIRQHASAYVSIRQHTWHSRRALPLVATHRAQWCSSDACLIALLTYADVC